MEEEKEEKIIEEEDLENEDLEDLRKYIEELTSFLPLPFCTINPINFILDTNQSFEHLTGYKKMEVIGMAIEELFLEKEEVDIFQEEVKKKKERVSREFTLITKDGETIPVKVSALSRRDEGDEFSGYFLTILDITEEKIFEEKLGEEIEKKTRELEEKAQEMEDSRSALLNILEDAEESYQDTEKERIKTSAIIESFVDGLMFFDKDKKLTIVNPQAEKFFDVKERDIVGRDMEELATFPTLKSLIKKIEEKEGALFREELQISEKTFLEVTTTNIELEDEAIGILVSLHDITREKRIEKIKSEFVSVAAHQLRTPLSGIKWILETVLEEGEGLDSEQKGLIKKACTANERMVGLINDLLDVTRIEEGRYVYKPKEIEVKQFIEPVAEEYRSKIEEKGVKLKIKEPTERIPRIKADEEKMKLVIQNFLDNAMKYTKEGEITVSIEILDNRKKVKVSISDTGAGIPEDQKERLFSKFFRAANVVRMETEGSGLGLFIAKNIIEAHEGEVGFDSKEGEGSTFFFVIPTVEKEDAESFIESF